MERSGAAARPRSLTVGRHVKRQRQRPAPSAKRTPARHRPAAAGVSFEQVRSVAFTFPGVEDGTSYGTPALKVRGKLLARLHQSLDCLVLRADFLDRQILMQSAPRAFFHHGPLSGLSLGPGAFLGCRST